MSGITGCICGDPSARTVARYPKPTPGWKSSSRPAVASSGAAAANSAQVAISAERP
jgi:hypothetical protein